jgi:hypothetical protein
LLHSFPLLLATFLKVVERLLFMACSTCGVGAYPPTAFAINPLATCSGGVSVPIAQDGSSDCNGVNIAGTCINQTALLAIGGGIALVVGAVVIYKMKGGKKSTGSAYSYGAY